MDELIPVYLELGKKKVFAGALDWPGWCRLAKDEAGALQALVEYGPRYAEALKSKRLGFHAPKEAAALSVVERLPGTGTTDFGAPDARPAADAEPLDAADLPRLRAILDACWAKFEAVAKGAAGKELRKGPRGGGRDVDGIVAHVVGAERAYLSSLGWKIPKDEPGALGLVHQAALDALAQAAAGALPERGPRGGALWPARYYARRSAWHILDHAWEIEDKVIRDQ